MWRNWIAPILYPNVGWIAMFAAIGLTAVGIAAIDYTSPGYASQQLKFVPLALIVMAACAAPSHRRLIELSYPAMILILICLVILLIPGMPRSFVPLRNGARRWFDLQVITVQPSELAKIAYVLTLAVYLRFRDNYRSFLGLLLPLMGTFIPMGLILKEPDLGTALIFMPVFFAMMIAAGAKLRHVFAIITIGLVLMPAMYPLLQPHQKARIVAMVSEVRGETRHRAGIGYQGYKAQTLVGAGQVTGHSEAHAHNLVKYNRLPERHNDMIFAVICTRWGALGGLLTLGLYVALIAGGLLSAALNKEPFARLIAVGITTVIFTQMFVNIGMTIGVLPITGLTLPFVSYGRASLLTSFMMIGLLLSVSARRRMIFSHRYFEYDRPQHDPVQRNPVGANR